MRIAILCLGSQGDVRPFVALGTALQKKGHSIFFATNSLHKGFCLQNGLQFILIPGDITACLKVEETHSHFGKIEIVRKLVRVLNESIHQQFTILNPLLRNVDVVIYHPVVFAAEHLVESTKIPSVCIHLQCNIPSRYYPCCFFPPRIPLGRLGNLTTHYLISLSLWLPFRKMINQWRITKLGLKKLSLRGPISHLPFQAIPKLIAVSPTLLSPAPDWANNVHVTGFLQLPAKDRWTPPTLLQQFLEDPPLYVGFGSLTERCNQEMTQAILTVLREFSIRAILCGQFLFIKQEELPKHILLIDAAPHDWLFPKVRAIVHHGGAGTTHTSLAAGKPTLMVPFLADQFHWGDITHRLGLGPQPLPAKKLNRNTFSTSLEKLLNTASYQRQAKVQAEKMKRENGVDNAVAFLEKSLHLSI